MLERARRDELTRAGSEILSLFLRAWSLGVKPYVGLVLTGTVDEVRSGARRTRFLPINGVEIIGYGEPADPSCQFLEELTHIRYARLFTRHLTHLESLRALTRLRDLNISYYAAQAIPVDLSLFPELQRANIEWFTGADTIFGARQLRELGLFYCPFSSSEPFGRLQKNLIALRLTQGRLVEVEALRRLSSLRWLALHSQRRLADFTGLSGHPTLGFLWIEGCGKLGNMEWLADMPQLETLRILDCGEVRGIEALRSLPELKHIHIHGRVNVITSDFSFLRGLPSLESVFIRGMPTTEADYWTRRNVRYDLIRLDLAG